MEMTLPIVVIGLALFLLAFVGLKNLWHTIFGLVAVLVLMGGLVLVGWGVSSNHANIFVWGCVLLLGGGAVLMYLKSAGGD